MGLFRPLSETDDQSRSDFGTAQSTKAETAPDDRTMSIGSEAENEMRDRPQLSRAEEQQLAQLLSAVKRNNQPAVRRLAKPEIVNGQLEGGWSLLMAAAALGFKDVMKILLEKEADLELEDDNGRTALMHAAVAGHQEVVTILLARGAHIDAKDHAGDNAQTLAEANGQKQIALSLARANRRSSVANRATVEQQLQDLQQQQAMASAAAARAKMLALDEEQEMPRQEKPSTRSKTAPPPPPPPPPSEPTKQSSASKLFQLDTAQTQSMDSTRKQATQSQEGYEDQVAGAQRASVNSSASPQTTNSFAGPARQSVRTSALPASARLRPSVRDEDEDVETEGAETPKRAGRKSVSPKLARSPKNVTFQEEVVEAGTPSAQAQTPDASSNKAAAKCPSGLPDACPHAGILEQLLDTNVLEYARALSTDPAALSAKPTTLPVSPTSIGRHSNSTITARELLERARQAIVAELFEDVTFGGLDTLHRLTTGSLVTSTNDLGQTPLMAAAHLGYRDVVALLIDKGAALEAKDTTLQRTSLMWAARAGHQDVVYLLAIRGAEMNGRDRCGDTAVTLAAAHGERAAVKALARHDADVEATGCGGFTALGAAARRGDAEMVELLLELGAKIDAADQHKRTPLQYAIDAASSGKEAVLEMLLNRGVPTLGALITAASEGDAKAVVTLSGFVDLNEADDEGQTALMRASWRGHAACVEALLDAGANIEAVDGCGRTAFDWALSAGQKEVVALLVANGCDTRGALLDATSFGDKELATLLIDNNPAQLEEKDAVTWQTPLITAAAAGKLDMVDLLLKAGASMDATDVSGRRAVNWALACGYIDIAQRLLGRGCSTKGLALWAVQSRNIYAARMLIDKTEANLDEVDADGCTALMLAVKTHQLEVVKMLLAAGADTDVTDKHGRRAMEMAVELRDTVAASALMDRNDASDMLFKAALEGDMEMLQLALKHYPDLEKKDPEGQTALYRAACAGQPEVVKALMMAGAQANVSDATGKTALESAVQWGKEEVVSLLVEHNCPPGEALRRATAAGQEGMVTRLLGASEPDIDCKGKSGQTALIIAAEKGYVNVVEKLLRFGADVEAEDDSKHTGFEVAVMNGHEDVVMELSKRNAAVRHGLILAVALGNPDMVALVLQRKVKLEERDTEGNTGLLKAVWTGNVPVLEQLMAAGADYNAADSTGRLAIDVAVDLKNVEVVCALVRAKADGHRALKRAAAFNAYKVIRGLSKAGVSLDTRDDTGTTVLEAAAGRGDVEMVKCLLDSGADLSLVDAMGWTPLARAVRALSRPVAELLIKCGAELNAPGPKGETLLMTAAYYNLVPVVDILLSLGADLEAMDPTGATALFYAVRGAREEVVKRLVAAGADVEREDDQGRTPLVMAARAQLDGMIKLLVSMGASVDWSDRKGYTALHWAAMRNDIGLCRTLLGLNAPGGMTDRDGRMPWQKTEDVEVRALLRQAAGVNVPELSNISIPSSPRSPRGDATMLGADSPRSPPPPLPSPRSPRSPRGETAMLGAGDYMEGDDRPYDRRDDPLEEREEEAMPSCTCCLPRPGCGRRRKKKEPERSAKSPKAKGKGKKGKGKKKKK